MRVIKFRGREEDGTWHFGNLKISYDEIKPNWTTVGAWIVERETVGQFTGLKDAEDNEIYEGDIIQNTEHEEQIYKVVWITDGWLGIDDKINGFLLGDLLDAAPFEVIGNIHDNPELLEMSK